MEKVIKWALIEAVIFLTVIFGIKYSHNQTMGQLQSNYDAARDTIEYLELKNGDLVAEKKAYLLSKNDFDEVLMEYGIDNPKELRKKLDAKPKFVTRVETEIEYDTIVVTHDSLVYINKYPAYPFTYDTEWLKFKGLTQVKDDMASTNIYNIKIPVPMVVGITDKRSIFVTSKNPYVNITDIQGAELDKSTFNKFANKFSLGIQGGIGGQYGLINKSFDVGPYIGLGINYKLF